MTAELTAALKAHRHLNEWVFCDMGGERLSRGALDWILKRVCRRANIRWIRWHGLRHTFCSHLVMRDAPARAIQELAGHASLMTTQRYMHLTPGAGWRDTPDCASVSPTTMTKRSDIGHNTYRLEKPRVPSSWGLVNAVGVLFLAASLACGDNITEGGPGDGDGDGDGDADASVDAPAGPNLVFVTSSRHTADLGGIAGADAICAARATEAGLPGNYVAWLSDTTTDAVDRIRGASGWVLTTGEPFAQSVEDILAGRIYYPINRDQTGAIHHDQIHTGTLADGTFDAANGDCDGWTSRAVGIGAPTHMTGVAGGGFRRFTEHTDIVCGGPGRLYCFGIDRAATIEPPAESGRIAFVTTGRIDGSSGSAAMDALCASEASGEGLPGSFLAAIATGSQPRTPPSDRLDSSGETWVRPDGVRLFANASDIDNSENSLLAPIQVTAGGQIVDQIVWTGTRRFSNPDGNGNCSDWSSGGSLGDVGFSTLSNAQATSSSLDVEDLFCTKLNALYCFEQ